MKRLSSCIADFYIKRNIIKPNDREVYEYGLSLIINDVVTFLLIFAISAIFDEVRFAAEFLLTFCVSRVFCGGYHAKKEWICRCLMIGIYLGVSTLSAVIAPFGAVSAAVIAAVSLVVLFILIPVRHPNKTLDEAEVKKNRRKGIITLVLFDFLSLCLSVSGNRDGFIIALSLFAVAALAVIGTLLYGGGEFHEKDC